jgi:hypothetical protein
MLQLDLVDLPTESGQDQPPPLDDQVDTADEAVLEDDTASQSSVTPSGGAQRDDNIRQVSREEAEAYAKECGLLFFEASAKTGANVGEVFTEIGE